MCITVKDRILYHLNKKITLNNVIKMHEKKGHNCPNFHNVLEKIINIGNISNLPATISKLKYKLRKRIRLEKLPI